MALLLLLGWIGRGYHEQNIRAKAENAALAKAQQAMVEYQSEKEEYERLSRELLESIQGDDAPLSPLYLDYLKRLSERTR